MKKCVFDTTYDNTESKNLSAEICEFHPNHFRCEDTPSVCLSVRRLMLSFIQDKQ